MSASRKKKPTGKVSSVTEELLSIRVKRPNLCEDLGEMATLVQWRKEDVGKLPSTVFTEVEMTFEDIVNAVKRNSQDDIVDGCTN